MTGGAFLLAAWLVFPRPREPGQRDESVGRDLEPAGGQILKVLLALAALGAGSLRLGAWGNQVFAPASPGGTLRIERLETYALAGWLSLLVVWRVLSPRAQSIQLRPLNVLSALAAMTFGVFMLDRFAPLPPTTNSWVTVADDLWWHFFTGVLCLWFAACLLPPGKPQSLRVFLPAPKPSTAFEIVLFGVIGSLAAADPAAVGLFLVPMALTGIFLGFFPVYESGAESTRSTERVEALTSSDSGTLSQLRASWCVLGILYLAAGVCHFLSGYFHFDSPGDWSKSNYQSHASIILPVISAGLVPPRKKWEREFANRERFQSLRKIVFPILAALSVAGAAWHAAVMVGTLQGYAGVMPRTGWSEVLYGPGWYAFTGYAMLLPGAGLVYVQHRLMAR